MPPLSSAEATVGGGGGGGVVERAAVQSGLLLIGAESKAQLNSRREERRERERGKHSSLRRIEMICQSVSEARGKRERRKRDGCKRKEELRLKCVLGIGRTKLIWGHPHGINGKFSAKHIDALKACTQGRLASF